MKNSLALLLVLFFAFTIPARAQSTLSGLVTLEASASDVTAAIGDLECGVAWVQFYLDNVAIGPLLTTPTSGTRYSFLWDSATATNGAHSLTAKAADHAGTGTTCNDSAPNVATSPSVAVTVSNGDVTPPAVIITSPSASVILSSPNTQVAARAQDPESGIAELIVSVNGTPLADVFGSETVSARWNSKPYKGQTVQVGTVAKNGAGLTSSTTMAVQVQ